MALHIDPTIHLGDILTTLLGAVITVIGYGLRKFYFGVMHFINRVESADTRIESSALVTDGHSDVMEKEYPGTIWPRVSQKRRREDQSVLHI